MDTLENLSEKMFDAICNSGCVYLGEKGTLDPYRGASKDCADVAIQFAIDLLQGLDGSNTFMYRDITAKISELQSLLTP